MMCDGLMKTLEHDHKQEEWQLLYDATRASLKVLLHIENEFPSFRFSCYSHEKSHKNMQLPFSCI
jgi:hypothetical protein